MVGECDGMVEMESGTPFAVSKLLPANVTAFRELLSVFGKAFEEIDTYVRKQPGQKYLQDLLARPEFIALAASAEGHVIGGLVAYELRKFEQERSEIYIYDLAVDAAHRRRGVATALIERLKDAAASSGAYVIFVQADIGDEPAIALYTKLGIREDVLHFDISPS